MCAQNVAITVRAISEIRALVSGIKTHDPIDITTAVTSFGGPLAAMVAGLEPDVDSVLAVVPMLDMHAPPGPPLGSGGSPRTCIRGVAARGRREGGDVVGRSAAGDPVRGA